MSPKRFASNTNRQFRPPPSNRWIRYAAFCCALNLAHLASCADAIFLRAATDSGFRAAVLLFPRSLARLAFCAKDIFRRASAEIIRCEPALRDPTEPFSDSIAVI